MAANPARLAVVGAGLIGRRHALAIQATKSASLAAIVDPADAAVAVAEEHGVPRFRSLDELIAAGCADGVILATPNQLHAEGGLRCIEAGLPVLVEKPLAHDLAGARALVEAAAAAGLPLATGHHRRHNPLIAKAKALIDAGRIGRIASVQATVWFMKPDAYFDVEWRRRRGAGPVYINLIHDVDLMMHFCGPVAAVQAIESNLIRGYEVEDTAAVILRFRSGALGTINVCDAAPAPWSWELTAAENSAYPATGQDCYWIAGTEAALTIPHLTLWSHSDKPSWWEPISATSLPVEVADPLVRQAEQFAAVVRDGAAPVVSGEDGLAALVVIDAIKRAAAAGAAVTIDGRG